LNSKTKLLDTYFTRLYEITYRKYVYKGIDLAKVSSRFFAGEFINNKVLISKINENNIDELIDSKINNEARFNLVATLKSLVSDFARYVYYSVKSQHQQAEIYFFISNPKFLKFFEGIRSELDRREISYAYIFWDNNEIPNSFPYKVIILSPKISKFFSKWNQPKYFLFTTVDRFVSTAKKISGSKVLIPEGCLASMHIIGELGHVHNYQTICLQWGFFGRSATKSGWRDMPYNKFLVWGDFFKSRFTDYNSLNIVTAGHPNLDLNQEVTNKSYILFAVQKELGDHISIKDVEFFLKSVYKIAELLPDKEIVLRTHPDLPFKNLPAKPSKKLENLKIHDFREFTLNQSFTGALMCIGISSTTIIESVAHNCYPIYVKANSLPLQIHEILDEVSELNHVFEFSQLSEFIENFNYENYLDIIKDLKNKFFSPNTIIEEILN
jgi:hypothetical protein